jgi:hypothetical protein
VAERYWGKMLEVAFVEVWGVEVRAGAFLEIPEVK